MAPIPPWIWSQSGEVCGAVGLPAVFAILSFFPFFLFQGSCWIVAVVSLGGTVGRLFPLSVCLRLGDGDRFWSFGHVFMGL